jgi:hypothetical protein
MFKNIVLLGFCLLSFNAFSKVTVCEYKERGVGIGIPKVSWDSETNEFKVQNILGYFNTGKFKFTEEIYDSSYAMNTYVKLNNYTYDEYRVVPTRNKSIFNISVVTFSLNSEGKSHIVKAKSEVPYECITM